MALQSFVDNNLPTIKAAWLNSVDVLLTTVFQGATSVATALTALGFSATAKLFVVAADAAAARLVIGAASLDSPLFTTKIGVPASTIAAPSLVGVDADSGINFDATGKIIDLVTDNVSVIRAKSSKLGVGGINPTALVHIKQSADSAAGGILFERAANTNQHAIFINTDGKLYVVNIQTGHFTNFDSDVINNFFGPLPFQRVYSSSGTTMVANTPLVFAHGLGVVPVLVIGYIVCQSADSGYSVADVIQVSLSTFVSPGGGIFGAAAKLDATNVTLNLATGFRVIKADGSTADIDISKWVIVIKALA